MPFTFFAATCNDGSTTVTVNPIPQLETAIAYLVQIIAELRRHDNTVPEDNSAELDALERLHQDALAQLELARANALNAGQVQIAITNLNTNIQSIVTAIANFNSTSISGLSALSAIIQAAEERELATLGGIKTAIEGMKPLAQTLEVVRLIAIAGANAQIVIPTGATSVEAYVTKCDDGFIVNGVRKTKGAGHLLENSSSANAIVTHKQQSMSFKEGSEISISYSYIGAPIRVQIANCTGVQITDPTMIAGFVAGNIADLLPVPDNLIQSEQDSSTAG
jgi:hypothetical protein